MVFVLVHGRIYPAKLLPAGVLRSQVVCVSMWKIRCGDCEQMVDRVKLLHSSVLPQPAAAAAVAAAAAAAAAAAREGVLVVA